MANDGRLESGCPQQGPGAAPSQEACPRWAADTGGGMGGVPAGDTDQPTDLVEAFVRPLILQMDSIVAMAIVVLPIQTLTTN